jgi:hypothetical protein
MARNARNHVARIDNSLGSLSMRWTILSVQLLNQRGAFWNPQPRLGQGRSSRGAAPKAPFRDRARSTPAFLRRRIGLARSQPHPSVALRSTAGAHMRVPGLVAGHPSFPMRLRRLVYADPAMQGCPIRPRWTPRGGQV